MEKKRFEYLISVRDKQIKEMREIIVGLEKSLDIASAYVLLLISDKQDRCFEVEKSEVSKLIGKVSLKMRQDGSKYIFELIDKAVPVSPKPAPGSLTKRPGKHPAKRTKK